MTTDTKLSKAQISNIIQPGRYLSPWLGNWGQKILANVTIPLDIGTLRGLVSNLVSNAIDKFE